LIKNVGKFLMEPKIIIDKGDVFGGRKRCIVKNGSELYNCYNVNYDQVMKKLKDNPTLAKQLKMGKSL
jgi:predicted rRNA methylase YqxC with S4 and FtsJ domains